MSGGLAKALAFDNETTGIIDVSSNNGKKVIIK